MPQLRQPRLAEMVASTLRERIISGALDDRARLPTLDRLVEEFGVSAPSVREALRILENEGLITVRRGNVGGATVHRPTTDAAAYMIGLVLQSRVVGVGDVAFATGELLTSCAALCAQRRDRAKAVVPALRDDLDRAEEAVDDTAAVYERVSRAFHQTLARGCGNASLFLLYETMDWLWSAQDEAWTRRVEEEQSPDARLRRDGLVAHRAIAEAIADGDAEAASRLTRAHVRHPQVLGLPARASHLIRATDLGPSRSGRDGIAPSRSGPDGSAS